MGDLEDVPIVGSLLVRLAGVATLLGDMVLHSGDLVLGSIMWIVTGVIGTPEFLLSITRVLRSLSLRWDWLPHDLLDKAVTVALVTMLVLYIIRFVESKSDKNS